MEFSLRGVTVKQFRQALRDASDHVGVVEPEPLRKPLWLWFRAVEAEASRWNDLLGRPCVAVWNAAQAVLNEHARRTGGQS